MDEMRCYLVKTTTGNAGTDATWQHRQCHACFDPKWTEKHAQLQASMLIMTCQLCYAKQSCVIRIRLTSKFGCLNGGPKDPRTQNRKGPAFGPTQLRTVAGETVCCTDRHVARHLPLDKNQLHPNMTRVKRPCLIIQALLWEAQARSPGNCPIGRFSQI